MEAERALSLLRKSVRDCISGADKVSVAYSGGLDSSVLAALAKDSAQVHCYTCATHDSLDARNAKTRAESECLDLTLVVLDEREISELVSEASRILDTSNPMQLAYTIPVLVVLKKAREKLILTGHGADELFGGYAKYIAASDPGRMMSTDLDKMLQEGAAIAKAAAGMGKRVAFPYASKEIVNYMTSLPLEMKVSDTERKILLREVAKLLLLQSHAIPKKAAQYSSGVLKEMRRLAKSEGVSLADWTSRVADRR